MVDSPCWGVSTGSYAGVSTVDPTTVTDDHWVRAEPPCLPSDQKTLGKWLVFKQFEELDATWHMIRKAVESGELDSTGAKCSTAEPDPSSYPKEPNTVGVICVYTCEETMDEVGFKLVHMVKQDIRYKTDEATLKDMYIATGYKKVTIKTIYWNDGEPYLKKHEENKGDQRMTGLGLECLWGGGGGNILAHPVLSTQYFGFLWPIHC